jgi:hypothetical protein
MHGRPTWLNEVQSNGAETWQVGSPALIAIDASASHGLEQRNVDTWNSQYSANPFLLACY